MWMRGHDLLVRLVVVALVATTLLAIGGPGADAQLGCDSAAEPDMIEVLVLTLVDDANHVAQPVYDVDDRALLGGSVGRVMYCLELDGEWVAAAFDAPSADPNLLGVPFSDQHEARERLAVTVSSSVPGVPLGVDLAGSIEFYPHTYSPTRSLGVPGGDDAVHDNDDTPGDARYGAMQVHVTDVVNNASVPVLSYNRWAGVGIDDLGHGPSGGVHPDWTFAGNAAGYLAKRLRVFATPGFGEITDAGSFQTGAVVPRQPDATSGSTAVEGVAPGADQIRATTWEAGVVAATATVAAAANGSFTIEVEVPAAPVAHQVRIDALIGGDWKRLATEADLVGGDVYLIQGQSNAVARVFGGGTGLEFLASPWIRSFGSSATTHQPDALHWNRAQAANGYSFGSIGQWGMQVGSDLLTANDVPVAVLNGGHGGQPAAFFQRNDADPFDPSTNYGRFLERVHGAGVDLDAAVIGWYQGESDWNQPAVHETNVNALFDDWLVDLPDLDLIHLVQVHNGCGHVGNPLGDLPVRDVQHEIGLARPEVDLVSTVALPDHDGCHYLPSGYAELGHQIAALTQRDVLGNGAPAGIDSPVAVSAAFLDAASTEVRLYFEEPTDVVDPNATVEFDVSDPAAAVTSVSAGAGWVDLTLDTGADPASTVRYLGVDAPWPLTPWGAAPVAFDGIAIDAVTDATADCNGQLDIVDALAIAQYTVGIRTDSGGCPVAAPADELHLAAGDVNTDGATDIVDALVIAQCEVGIVHPICP